ncbi:MAG: hypothetical protein ING59_15875 [Burkholderiales bacterium]|nr:hypothetical protein [Burkholderiales bacterium]
MLLAAERGDDAMALRIWQGLPGSDLNLQSVLPYELAAASEFWAINGARLMRQRAEGRGWQAVVRRWYQALMAKARELLGLSSDAAVLRGIAAVLAGDGTFVSPTMISRLDVLRSQDGRRRQAIDTDDPVVRFLDDLAQSDEAFSYPISTSRGLHVIARTIWPGAEVERITDSVDTSNEPFRTLRDAWEIRHPALPETRRALVFTNADGEVWLDISQWAPGQAGSRVYQMVGDFAHNAGLRFIGDPMGLSDAAAFRRTNNLLSSALRWGTTDHIEPASRQMRDDASTGLDPIDWRRGNHAYNIRELARRVYDQVRAIAPEIEGISYDVARGRFSVAGDAAERAADAGARQSEARNERRDRQADDAQEALHAVGRKILGARTLGLVAGPGATASEAGLRTARVAALAGSLARTAGTARGRVLLDRLAARRVQPLGDLANVFYDRTPRRREAGNPVNRWELPSETRMQTARRVAQDYLLRLRVVQDAITAQGGTVGQAQDAYRAEERMHGRIQAQLEQFKDDRMRPLMTKLARLDLTPGDLALYAYAKHAAERNRYVERINPDLRGNGSGMSDAAASDVLDRFLRDGKADALEDVHADLLAITRATRRKLLDADLISQDQFDRWELMFRNYVPLRGFERIEFDADGRPVVKPRGGIDVRGEEAQHLEGRTSRAATILENVILDYERAVVRAERNAVGKVFLDLVQTNPDPALWEVQPLRRDLRDDPQLAFFDVQEAVRLADVDKGDDTIGVKVGGQAVYIRIKDPLLRRAMQRAYLDETGDLQRLIAESVGWYSNWLRNTLTRWNPAFVVINSIRDAQTGAISTLDTLGWGATATYARHYTGALAAAARNETRRLDPQVREWDRWFTEFKAAGGITGGFFMRDTTDVFDELRAEILEAGGDLDPRGSGVARLADRAWLAARGTRLAKLAASTLRAVEMMGGASESAARVGAYRTAREMGKTPAEAASIAKNLTVNFNRKGEWGTALNSLYLFFNAAVQGSHRTLVALKNPRVQAAMAGLTGLAMALALGNAEWGGDDDDGESNWDKVPDFVKERNLVVMIPPAWNVLGVSDKAGQAKYIKIPLPYGFNVFAVLGNSLADTLRNLRDPRRGITPAKAAINLTSAVAGSFNPVGGSFDPTDPVQVGMAAAPTVLDLPIQLATERSGWGRPAVSTRSPYDERPDSERYFLSDAGTAQQRIAQWLNASTGGDRARSGAIDVAPGTLETAVRSATGGLGTFLADVASTVGQLGDSTATVNPANVPIFKALYGQHDNRTDQARFYENRKEIEQRYRQGLAAIKLGIRVDLDDPENKAVMQLGETLVLLNRHLGQLRRAEIAVIENAKLGDEAKRLERERIDNERTKLMRAFNKTFTETFRPAGRQPKQEPVQP